MFAAYPEIAVDMILKLAWLCMAREVLDAANDLLRGFNGSCWEDLQGLPNCDRVIPYPLLNPVGQRRKPRQVFRLVY